MMKIADKEALFKTTIEDSRDRIYRICCCYVRNKDERKDVFQEVLMHIWENLHKFEGRSEISTWIYRIAVNSCLSHRRSEARRNHILLDKPLEEHEQVPANSPEAEARHNEENLTRLYGAINDLPPLDRMLVSLYLEDVSTKEMADILGISESNTRVKLHRIKANLKLQLEDK